MTLTLILLGVLGCVIAIGGGIAERRNRSTAVDNGDGTSTLTIPDSPSPWGLAIMIVGALISLVSVILSVIR